MGVFRCAPGCRFDSDSPIAGPRHYARCNVWKEKHKKMVNFARSVLGKRLREPTPELCATNQVRRTTDALIFIYLPILTVHDW